jgi:hypothetical protein
MALTSTLSNDLRTHLQEGAIYRDRSDNVIRLLSICPDYCVYVYVSLTNLPSSMHGSVTGLTRKDVFGANFVFVAGSVKDWIGNQPKHDVFTDSSGIVFHTSRSRPAQHQGVDSRNVRQAHDNTEGKPWLSTSWGTRMGAKSRQRSA